MEYKRRYREMADDTKKKISAALRGRSKGAGHKERISAGLRNYWSQVPHRPFGEDE